MAFPAITCIADDLSPTMRVAYNCGRFIVSPSGRGLRSFDYQVRAPRNAIVV
jgi:hypothetical protein